MKKNNLLIILILLLVCTSIYSKNKDNKESEITPVLKAEVDEGLIIGHNKGNHFFILFFPGKKTEIKIIKGRLVFLVDRKVFQLNTFELDPEEVRNHSTEEILTSYSKWEIDYTEKVIKKKLELIDNYFIKNKDESLYFHLWGCIRWKKGATSAGFLEPPILENKNHPRWFLGTT